MDCLWWDILIVFYKQLNLLGEGSFYHGLGSLFIQVIIKYSYLSELY